MIFTEKHGSINNITVAGCDIYGNVNGWGIRIKGMDGPYQLYDMQVLDTKVHNNYYGIRMGSASIYSNHNLISGCEVYENTDRGISLESSDSECTRNTIYDNGGIGLTLWDNFDNEIYHNNFINNTQNAYDAGSNTWDNGYPFRGNHWDNFDEPIEGAWDNNSDSIVDSPYNIPGGSNQDNYPLTWHYWKYDSNCDGIIQKSEVIKSIQDYFDYLIEKWQVIKVIQLYFST